MIALLLLAAVAAATTNHEPTVVTSDRLSVAYAQNLGTFEGNVLAVDPRITVRADKMTVWFGSITNVADSATNLVRTAQRIVAEGSVVIATPDERNATSDHAVYTANDGKVVLTGKPQVKSADGVVTGKKITFWRNESKMDVESDVTETNRTRLIIYPDEPKKKE